jgi:hypothetical protein
MGILKNNKAQEEIVGFAVIVIIVSIILAFFLIFSLSNKTQTESYEAASFLQSSLQYTSSCVDNFENLPVQSLIISCYRQEKCQDEQDACAVLNSTLNEILEKSWQVGEEFPIKGYKLEIASGDEQIFLAEKGNATGSYKGAQQVIPEGDLTIQVLFRAYY